MGFHYVNRFILSLNGIHLSPIIAKIEKEKENLDVGWGNYCPDFNSTLTHLKIQPFLP